MRAPPGRRQIVVAPVARIRILDSRFEEPQHYPATSPTNRHCFGTGDDDRDFRRSEGGEFGYFVESGRS